MSYLPLPMTPVEEASKNRFDDYKVSKSDVSNGGVRKKFDVFQLKHLFVVFCLISVLISGFYVSPSRLFLNLFRKDERKIQIEREYNLTTGFKWANPDGGRWRVMFVCNGVSPCPILSANEGDIVKLNIQNDVGTQSSIHWSGMNHRRFGDWNDGTGGVNQYPILPRGNWTSYYDTSDYWGLGWYGEHTTGTINDGLSGAVWVSPSPTRQRPYSKIIGDDSVGLHDILEAEQNAKHLIIKNHWQRTTDWKVLQMRAEGTEFYCYDSILVNGKGRSHCRHPDYPVLGGVELDATGCVRPQGTEVSECTPGETDYEVIETNSRPWMMLNLLNIGFEHSVKLSIDGHKMWIVANDGGFTEPELVDVVYITNAARVTVLVKLNAEPIDYAIRISSTSQVQMLQGYAILRYPAKRYPIYGEPMTLPEPREPSQKCLLPDASINEGCKEADINSIPPFPAFPPPKKATHSYHLEAGMQASKTEPHVPEFFLNEKPWQLFHASMTPVLFSSNLTSLDKPVISSIPVGSIVDVITQNTINETISLYKHGEPAWLLGSAPFSKFDNKNLNLIDPPLVISHDLPPLGWAVLRYRVDKQGASFLHAAKLKYFLLGMSVPILEGITDENPLDAPISVKNRPYVEFEPKHDGIFGK